MLHALVGLAFWALFVYLWVDVVRDGKAAPQALALTAVQVVGVAAVVLLVTLVWIRHNVSIHRRRGPRPGRATAAADTTHDRLGRPVAWQLPGGSAAAVIAPHLVADVVDGQKVYAAAPHSAVLPAGVRS